MRIIQKTLSFLLFFLLIQVQVFGQINANIPLVPGAGFNYRPLGAYWGYDRSQLQYSSAELIASGIPSGIVISRVSFYLTGFNAPAQQTPVKVYLKEVFGAAGLVPNTFANITSNATLCFVGSITSSGFAANTWIPINLTTPFYFGGGGSHLEVIVETNFGGGGGENFNGKIFSRSTAPGSYHQYWAADNNPPLGNGIVTTSRPDIQISYTVATPCTGIPSTVGALANPSSVCANRPYAVALSGLYPPYASGYTFQWSSSTAGPAGPFTNLPGATQAIYSSPGQIATTWYQCQIQCSNGSSTITAPVQVSMNQPTSCYCTSGANFSTDTDIGQVVFGPLTNPATVGTPTNNVAAINTYSDFTQSLPPQNYTQGQTYPITLRQISSGNYFYTAFFNVFIDYNRDGFFDPVTERVYSGGPTGPTSISPATTFVSGNITIPYSSQTGTTRMRVILVNGGNNTNPPCGTYARGETEDYNINIVAGIPCGLSNAGSATSSLSNTCPNQAFVLGISGTTNLGSGMTWQWQSAPTAVGPWSNIAGATYYPLARIQSATTFYRCQVTCGAVSLFTTPVQVVQNTATQCYCTPVHIPNCNNMWTANVTFNTLNNQTGCSSNLGLAYNSYPATGNTTTSVTQNQTYNLSVTTGGIVNAIISVWIDYDFDGLYEPTEWYQITTSTPPGVTRTIPITIPSNSGTGLTGMRVRSRFSGNPNGSTAACITFGSGETEDYLITILPFTPPPCAGTPGPFSTTTSASTVCSGTDVVLSLSPSSSTVFSGLTYQWMSGPTASGPWTNMSGAIAKTYLFSPTVSAWYRCQVTCSNSGQTVFSSPALVTVNPATWLGFTDDWSDPTNWCGRVPTLNDDARISLVASGRPPSQYYFPLASVGDTVRARNLVIEATDSMTVLTDSSVFMEISQDLTNLGSLAVISSKGDTVTFGFGTTTSAMLQPFRGLTTTDNILQVIYTAVELQASGMLPNDRIDSLAFRFYNRQSVAPYENMTISYGLLPAAQDQFTAADPLTGLTTVYANSSLVIASPSNGVYHPISATQGVLTLPVSGMVWDGVSNLVLSVCYDMTANGSTGGNDLMYLSTTSPRKSCLWLGSNVITSSGCNLTSASANLLPTFGTVPSTLRPNIGFRFSRPQVRLPIDITGQVNNLSGARLRSSFAGWIVDGSISNEGWLMVDTTNVFIGGDFINNGSADLSYFQMGAGPRKSFIELNGVSWANNGNFNPGNSRVSFIGSAAQTIGGSNSTTFHELRIAKGAASQSVTLLNSTTVDDTLDLGSGQFVLNGQTVTINNYRSTVGTINAPVGPITRTGGFIICEDTLSFTAYVRWNVGLNTGWRVVPFGHSLSASPAYIPFSFNHLSGDLGQFSIATYKTPPGNLPYPPTVTHLNVFNSANSNFTNVADRFWLTEKTGSNPRTNLCFRYAVTAPSERATGASVLNRPAAQPWRTANNGSYGAWLRVSGTGPAGSTLGTSTTYSPSYAQTASFDSVGLAGWDWPILPAVLAYNIPSAPIGNFIPWAISNSSTPLPVELLDFQASRVGNRVRLRWSTVTETDCDFFTPERTFDFQEHIELDDVPGSGNSSILRYYEAWDEMPGKGINYYRLKQTDYDGTSHIVSPYVAVRFESEGDFAIRYVETGNGLTVFYDLDQEGPVHYYLFDASGRLLLTGIASSTYQGSNTLETGFLIPSSGIYTMQIVSQGRSSHFRFFHR